MKDILGREIKVGDIVAHGTRSGNSGDLNVKIVAGVKEDTCKVINYYYGKRKWNPDIQEWKDVPAFYEKGGSGWAQGNILIVTESVPDELHYFLKGLIPDETR